MKRTQSEKTVSSPYITPEGHKKLSDELSRLWKVKRPQVTQAVSEAAAMGDRSENAEYIYGKKQLRQIDGRIRFLIKRLNELEVVDRLPDDQSRVYFGAWVKIENEDGEGFCYRIVGADETDAKKGHISIDSPMAKALIRKSEGDEAMLKMKSGTTVFFIKDICYSPPADNEADI
jgi:transcription elongation factor GreB